MDFGERRHAAAERIKHELSAQPDAVRRRGFLAANIRAHHPFSPEAFAAYAALQDEFGAGKAREALTDAYLNQFANPEHIPPERLAVLLEPYTHKNALALLIQPEHVSLVKKGFTAWRAVNRLPLKNSGALAERTVEVLQKLYRLSHESEDKNIQTAATRTMDQLHAKVVKVSGVNAAELEKTLEQLRQTVNRHLEKKA